MCFKTREMGETTGLFFDTVTVRPGEYLELDDATSITGVSRYEILRSFNLHDFMMELDFQWKPVKLEDRIKNSVLLFNEGVKRGYLKKLTVH